MSIKLGNYSFQGPYHSMSPLQNSSGVYAVLDCQRGGDYVVLDIGESSNVKERVKNHDRERCWRRQKNGTLTYAAYYCAESQRMNAEKMLRRKYSPACGLR